MRWFSHIALPVALLVSLSTSVSQAGGLQSGVLNFETPTEVVGVVEETGPGGVIAQHEGRRFFLPSTIAPQDLEVGERFTATIPPERARLVHLEQGVATVRTPSTVFQIPVSMLPPTVTNQSLVEVAGGGHIPLGQVISGGQTIIPSTSPPVQVLTPGGQVVTSPPHTCPATCPEKVIVSGRVRVDVQLGNGNIVNVPLNAAVNMQKAQGATILGVAPQGGRRVAGNEANPRSIANHPNNDYYGTTLAGGTEAPPQLGELPQFTTRNGKLIILAVDGNNVICVPEGGGEIIRVPVAQLPPDIKPHDLPAADRVRVDVRLANGNIINVPLKAALNQQRAQGAEIIAIFPHGGRRLAGNEANTNSMANHPDNDYRGTRWATADTGQTENSRRSTRVTVGGGLTAEDLPMETVPGNLPQGGGARHLREAQAASEPVDARRFWGHYAPPGGFPGTVAGRGGADAAVSGGGGGGSHVSGGPAGGGSAPGGGPPAHAGPGGGPSGGGPPAHAGPPAGHPGGGPPNGHPHGGPPGLNK